jgi:predicted metal-dependent hydrolase
MSPDERQQWMMEGQAAFNRAAFFEAHESWEKVWLVTDTPRRGWVQGLIQIATALYKVSQGRPDLGITLMQKGLAKLQEAPTALYSLDVAELRRDIETALRCLQAKQPIDVAAIKLAVWR